MTQYFYFFFIGFLCWSPVLSQNDSIETLEEVLIETKLKDFSTGQTLWEITGQDIYRSSPLLTSALKYNTSIYLRENGLGMVASPSFRGTSAAQTAVLWNGININSRLNGQTDFNTINAAGYNEITVRGGGGSVVYGSGAIGGTVHLNNRLDFREKFENQVFLQYGSYHTANGRYRLKAARGNWSLSLSLARTSSDNDYEYPDDKGKNHNGQFYNNMLNLGLAYRMDHRNTLRFHSEYFQGERHFSLIRASETRTKYRNLDLRNLLEWKNQNGDFTSIARLAHLNESYKYFGNITSENTSFGEAESFIAKYDLEYALSKNLTLSSALVNTHTSGTGSGLENGKRNIFSAAFLMKHRLSEKFSYESGLRTEITSTYESPLLFSVSGKYLFSKFYGLKLNASRNFRIPTFNDLYWISSGQTGLRPETSLQGEVGNQFRWKNLELNLTAYYIDIRDMIRWIPGNDGVWRPENEDEVRTYGMETLLEWRKRIGWFGTLDLKGSYAYTASENSNTGHQLIYVPYHKATASLEYSRDRWQIKYQFLYTGEVFTRTDNDARYNLDSYMVSDLGLSYSIGRSENHKLGARVQNILDQNYQSMENRWMPGVNFNMYLNLNF